MDELQGFDGNFFSVPSLNFEKALCEIIDNSIDSGNGETVVVNVVIQPEQAPSRRKNSFRIYIYDNGNGFGSENDLHSAFQLSRVKKPSKKNKIGCFHWGMKTASLAKFDHFSLITKIGNKFFNRSIRHPGKHNPDDYYIWRGFGIDKSRTNPNPSDKVPAHVGESGIIERMKKNDFTTCAVLTCPRGVILTAQTGKRDVTYHDELLYHLNLYFGMIYQELIEDGKTIIKLGKTIDDATEVIPCDPFLSGYTPNKMLELAGKPENKEQKVMLETIAPYGTLATERKPCTVKVPKEFGGGEKIIHVTGYFIPDSKIRHRILKAEFNDTDPYGRQLLNHRAAGGLEDKVKEISTHMDPKHLQGFYFYRGKRAIIFGAEPANSAGGFWHGLRIKRIASLNWAVQVRIKVEYEPSEDGILDTMFDLAPNKHTFDGSPHEAIWAAIEDGLIQTINGEKCGHATPLNTTRPFHVPGKGDEHIGSIPIPNKCKQCTYVHEKNMCPLGDCLVCKLEKSVNKCTPTQCKSKCKHCDKIGDHPENECPTIPKPVDIDNGPTITKPKKKAAGLGKLKQKGDYYSIAFDPKDSAQGLKVCREILKKIGKTPDDI